MAEAGATNLGVADCMTGLIPILDTPPCLALAELNDEGLTAFCHTDLTHTMPGVLMRWIAGKPSFVCNANFPHHGLLTLAHCAAPRKMNGRDLEPTRIMTHYESDYGAATKVEYRRGQVVTCIVPNLRSTKWFAFGAGLSIPFLRHVPFPDGYPDRRRLACSYRRWKVSIPSLPMGTTSAKRAMRRLKRALSSGRTIAKIIGPRPFPAWDHLDLCVRSLFGTEASIPVLTSAAVEPGKTSQPNCQEQSGWSNIRNAAGFNRT